MGVIKTTVNIDERIWNEFKRVVSSQYGGVKSLSRLVEEALRSFNTLELLELFLELWGVEVGIYPSSREVVERRPKLETSAGRVVREMRDEREACISGYK